MKKCLNCSTDLHGKQRMYCSRTCKHKHYTTNYKFDIDDSVLQEIKALYAEGMSFRRISILKGIPKYSLWELGRSGIIPMRTHSQQTTISNLGRIHSSETKEKISNSRKKFLKDNPDMVPYKLNHKHKKTSYPEQFFLECFNGKFSYQYQFGTYSLDFADVENKLDIEIDGCQHRLDPRIVEHDIKRNSYLNQHGWNVLRINWSMFQKLNSSEREDIINSLLEEVNPYSPAITYFNKL